MTDVHQRVLDELSTEKLVDQLSHIFRRLANMEPAVFLDGGKTDLELFRAGTTVLAQRFKADKSIADLPFAQPLAGAFKRSENATGEERFVTFFTTFSAANAPHAGIS